MGVIYNRNRKKGLFYIPSGGLGPSVSADFAYGKSSYNQGEADPTPTITGTAGGSFNADAGVVFVDTGSFNSSTGQIDLSATTIDSHIITYTVDGVQSGQTVGVTAVPYQSTSSFTFDGVNDYFDAGTSLNSTINGVSNNFSISCWIKANTGSGSVRRGIIGNYTTASATGFYLDLINSSANAFTLRAGYHGASGYNLRDNTTTLVADGNTWYNIIVTVSGNTSGDVVVYVNGIAENGTTIFSSPSSYTITANLEVSHIAHGPSNRFSGNIDEVSIWNTALSSDAVTEIASGPNDLTSLTNASNTNLKAWYKF